MRTAWLSVGMVLVSVSSGHGVTVTFDVVSDINAPQATVMVEAGSTVPYVITVIVDEPANTSGLAGGSVDLLTKLGVTQPPATQINTLLAFLSDTGTSQDDDLFGIAGSQNVFGAGSAVEFARNQTETFAQGTLQAPQLLGTYSVMLANGNANVLEVDLATNPVNAGSADAVVVGAGFMIQVVEAITTVSPPDPPSDPPSGPDDPPDGPPTTEDEPAPTGFCGASLPAYAVANLLGLMGLRGRRWFTGP